MFTGIIESVAQVTDVRREPETDNITLLLSSDFADELRIDQSVAHNGVCLTVDGLYDNPTRYSVTAIRETLERSNLGDVKVGDRINLERSMPMNGRLDGHIVQGHVDTTGTCTKIEEAEGSTYFTIEYDIPQEMVEKGYMTVEKGSVCINGVSLTVCDSEPRSFRVAIIPYTLEHTNFGTLHVGNRVNLEFDIIGKYLARLHQLTTPTRP